MDEVLARCVDFLEEEHIPFKILFSLCIGAKKRMIGLRSRLSNRIELHVYHIWTVVSVSVHNMNPIRGGVQKLNDISYNFLFWYNWQNNSVCINQC